MMQTLRRVCVVLAATTLVTLAPATAKTIDLDSATIADFNAAFNAGTLTAEKLVQMCLARIEAYDRQGPALRAVITVNPKALETARALDAERKSQRAALAAARHSRRAERQLRHRRHADDRRLGAARRLRAARRCVPGEEAARGRRDHRRQGQHVGVRLGRRAQLARRTDR